MNVLDICIYCFKRHGQTRVNGTSMNAACIAQWRLLSVDTKVAHGRQMLAMFHDAKKEGNYGKIEVDAWRNESSPETSLEPSPMKGDGGPSNDAGTKCAENEATSISGTDILPIPAQTTWGSTSSVVGSKFLFCGEPKASKPKSSTVTVGT